MPFTGDREDCTEGVEGGDFPSVFFITGTGALMGCKCELQFTRRGFDAQAPSVSDKSTMASIFTGILQRVGLIVFGRARRTIPLNPALTPRPV